MTLSRSQVECAIFGIGRREGGVMLDLFQRVAAESGWRVSLIADAPSAKVVRLERPMRCPMPDKVAAHWAAAPISSQPSPTTPMAMHLDAMAFGLPSISLPSALGASAFSDSAGGLQ